MRATTGSASALANLQNQVFPIHAEAHALPFASDFFDTLLSFDAYHYFGTDDLYLGYVSQFVRPGGLMGIVVPGVLQELNGEIPAHLASYWQWDWWSFHSPDWWRQHWGKTGLVEVVHADVRTKRVEALAEVVGSMLGCRFSLCLQMRLEMLRVDAGRTLGFTRLVARKK